MSDAAATSAFPIALAAFSSRIAASGIGIYGVAYDFLHFGSWTIEVGRRHDRLLIQWGGKESLLTLSTGEMVDSSSPRDWKMLKELSVGGEITEQRVLDLAADLVLQYAGA